MPHHPIPDPALFDVDAVIFDMDGVVIDSEPLHKRVFQDMAQAIGIHVDDEEYSRFTGRSPLVQWEHMAATRSIDRDPQELAREQVERYLALVQEPGVAQPAQGLEGLFDLLEARNLAKALASSNDRRVVDTVPGLLGIAHRFQAMVSGEDVAAPKPAPDIFLTAARKLGVDPLRCLVVEDATNGVAAAKAANMRCIGLANPNSGSQDLSAADLVVPSMAQLAAALLNRS